MLWNPCCGCDEVGCLEVSCPRDGVTGSRPSSCGRDLRQAVLMRQ